MAPSEEINIPQKPPMVMVDRILVAGGAETVTSFSVRQDNVFVENGCLAEPGLIENMAQTAAAGTGATGPAGSQPPRIGFIGGIKDLVINCLPKVGEEIVTRVKVEHTVMDASVIKAEVISGERVIASCEMKIFLQP
jgi:predicted hotdog family 3-hydroxylacyl-ACP dehydratase